MRIASRTLLTLILGVALAVTAFAAQGAKPNIGQVLIIVKDLATKQEIGSVEPGGTITIPAGSRVRLIMSALPTGAARGPLYPETTFSETSAGGVTITRSNVENSSADVEIPRGKANGRTEVIRYQITESWVPANLRTGSFRIRVAPAGTVAEDQASGGAVFSGSRAEQLTRMLYQGILMRDLDSGAQGSIDAIANGGYDALVRVATGIAGSEESRVRLAGTSMEQRLASLYRHLLGITPEQADARQWSSDLRRMNDGQIADVVADIVQSDRFRERNNLVGVRY
ncbi:MAG TPA: hypothetical protein VGG03_02480 [Thermoanaerobaculia bacterium]|jgi:hypothetical protein